MTLLNHSEFTDRYYSITDGTTRVNSKAQTLQYQRWCLRKFEDRLHSTHDGTRVNLTLTTVVTMVFA